MSFSERELSFCFCQSKKEANKYNLHTSENLRALVFTGQNNLHHVSFFLYIMLNFLRLVVDFKNV